MTVYFMSMWSCARAPERRSEKTSDSHSLVSQSSFVVRVFECPQYYTRHVQLPMVARRFHVPTEAARSMSYVCFGGPIRYAPPPCVSLSLLSEALAAHPHSAMNTIDARRL